MDADDFLKKVAPSVHRSRLSPHWEDIVKLRAHGCTLDQVRTFLAAHQVEVTRAGLSQYIRHRVAREALGRVSNHVAVTESPVKKIGTSVAEDTRKISNPADLRKSRKREIDLDDYLTVEGE